MFRADAAWSENKAAETKARRGLTEFGKVTIYSRLDSPYVHMYVCSMYLLRIQFVLGLGLSTAPLRLNLTPFPSFPFPSTFSQSIEIRFRLFLQLTSQLLPKFMYTQNKENGSQDRLELI